METVFYMIQKNTFTLNAIVSSCNNLSREEKSKYIHNLLALYRLFKLGVGLSQPYYICLDHSLLVAIRDREKEKPSYLAILTFAYFLQNFTDYEIRIAILPVVLFEWLKRKPLSSLTEYSRELESLYQSLTFWKKEIFLVGYTSPDKIQITVNNIVNDIEEIIMAIQSIKKKLEDESTKKWQAENAKRTKKWDMSMSGENFWIWYAPAIVSQLVPHLKLAYFSPFYVQRCLSSLIEKEFVAHSSDEKVRSGFNITLMNKMASLMKIEKKQLKGIGDIDIWSHCNIGNQFINKMSQTFIGLTFDDTLAIILKESATLKANLQILGGEKEDIFKEKREEYVDNIQRIDSANLEKDTYTDNFIQFLFENFTQVLSEIGELN